MADRVEDIWGSRTPIAMGEEWPSRVDQHLEDGIEGWVDVSFLVSAAGDVTDARVEAAQPRARFDRAALSSVSQWKFEPRPADAVDPTLRIKTRVKFELAD